MMLPGRSRAAAPSAAGLVFLALLPLAAALYSVKGRSQWFFQDEWVFFSTRDGDSVRGLLDPHNEHWSTIPVIVYRLLWNTVGAQSYQPYQALSIGLHLVVAVLLRAVMRRRLGVGPWLATAAAGVFLLYGSGAEAVVWAFELSFSGALALGLAHLLLVDHPAPSPRRRVAGLACGIGSLMFSGIGLIMAGVVGLAVLAGRGWRAAAWCSVPPGVVYLAWWATFATGAQRFGSDLGLVARFTATGLGYSMGRLGQSPLVTGGLLAVTVLGIGMLAWQQRRSLESLRRRLAVPLALVVGAVTFYALTGLSRAEELGVSFSTRSRYAYVGVALVMPVIALGFDRVVRRWPLAAVPAFALLLAGVPGNVSAIEVRSNDLAPPALVLAVAHSPALADAPDGYPPFAGITGYSAITAGWLREAATSARIPQPPRSPGLAAEAVARLTLPPNATLAHAAPDPHCVALARDRRVRITTRSSLVFVGGVRVVVVMGTGRSTARTYRASKPSAIAATGAPVTVLVRPASHLHPTSLCRWNPRTSSHPPAP
jgi:hypothetical protein